MHRVPLIALILSGSFCGAIASAAPPRAYQRPLSDFTSAQGTTQVVASPVPDYIAWTDPASGLMMAVDYAGVADQWTWEESGHTFSYGTTITGTITEKPLADGRADVQVVLHAHNALSYVVAFDPATGQGDFSDVRFGRLAPDAQGAGDAALGDCDFQIRIVNTAPHAPLPDIFDAFVNGNADPRIELVFISFSGRATGTLGAGAIAGVPEGTEGRASTRQTGIFMSGFHGHVGAQGGFPAESVTLRAAP
jgi:hypothetical protein